MEIQYDHYGRCFECIELTGLNKNTLMCEKHDYEKQLATANEIITVLEEANGFYADKKNWCGNKPYLWITIDVGDTERVKMEDDFDVPVSPKMGGKRARDAQKRVQELRGKG